MRVVFDTNVLVSALVFHAGRAGGRSDEAVRRVLEGEDELIVSRDILRELLDALARKFDHDAEQLSRVAIFVAELGELVEPNDTTSILEDPADNRILGCAAAGNAALIVTGDLAMLELGKHGNTRIISLRAYLERDR